MNKINIYIISWTGFHESATLIYDEISNNSNIKNLKIIYSDSNPFYRLDDSYRSILVENEKYWGGKFEVLMNDNLENIDTMVIQADAKSESWNDLVNRFHEVFLKYSSVGVWTPKINFTTWHKERVFVSPTSDPKISVVAQTDGIVFGFRGFLLERLRAMDFSENNIGWGIDWVLIISSIKANLVSVMDEHCYVHHKKGSGYDHSLALQQMNKFLSQLSINEKFIFNLLKSRIAYLDKISHDK